MTKEKVQKAGAEGKGGAGEAEGGELTTRLYIRYDLRYYRDGVSLDNPPDEFGARLGCALAALTHLEAMFDVLCLLGGGGSGVELDAETLENFGALGQSIASEAYGQLIDLPRAPEGEGAARG